MSLLPAPIQNFLATDHSRSSSRRAAGRARAEIKFVGAMFVGLILFCLLAPADRVVLGHGKVVPVGDVRIINHPTGGRIEAILVRNGDHVVAGQTLLRLDQADLHATLIDATTQQKTVTAEIDRLESFLDERAPSVTAAPDDDIAARQRALLESELEQLASQEAALTAEINTHDDAARAAAERIASARQALAISAAQAEIYGKLVKKGYVSLMRAYQARRDVLEARNVLNSQEASLEREKDAAQQARARLAGARSDARVKVQQALTDAHLRLSQVDATIGRAKHALQMVDIKSPVSGYVEELSPKSSGEAVAANADILHVVPDAAELRVEATVAPADIALLKTGEPAAIKPTAFEYQRFGALPGVIESVAQDTAPLEIVPGRPGQTVIYKIVVKPILGHMPNDPTAVLRVGMLADVDFFAGRRSIADYVLDTVLRSRDRAFRE